MKKILTVLTVVLCLSLFTIPCFADEVFANATPVADSTLDQFVSAFFSTFDSALQSIGGYYNQLGEKFPEVASYLSIPHVIFYLILAFFGYALYKKGKIFMGGLFGFCFAFVILAFLGIWTDAPEFIQNLLSGDKANLVKWFLAGILTVIGLFVGESLKRFGFSIALATIFAGFASRYTSNGIVLLVLFGFLFFMSLCAFSATWIGFSSMVGSVQAIKLLFGADGFYPVNFSKYLQITNHDLVIVAIGTILGIFCIAIQFNEKHKRRYF